MRSKLRDLLRRFRSLRRLADAADHPVQFSKYLPGRPSGVEEHLSYHPSSPDAPLPVPPPHLWLGYGSDEAGYLGSGEEDVRKMREILASLGADLDQATRPVLDLGCGAGRMIRHLRPLASRTELWGLDISAAHIGWLKTRLNPPFHFAVNTTLPHLPFSDGYFGHVYCGSVFTHIDDLAESWFLEVRRVLAPGGVLYCTLHDEHTRGRLQKNPQQGLARSLQGHALLEPGREVADIIVTGRGHESNVYYHSRYLRAMLGPLFEIIGVIPGAYGYQTAWILRKRPAA